MVNRRFLDYARRTANSEVPELRMVRETPEVPVSPVRGSFSDYREFFGKNTEQMALLIAEGRTPMSVPDLLVKRTELLTSRNPDSKEFDYFMNNYFDTGDGVVYLPNGDLIIAYDAQALRVMNGKSKLVNNALNLKGVDVGSIKGHRFSKADLERMIIGKHLSLEQAKSHPLWLALTRNNKKLLDDYSDAFFAHAKTKYDYDSNMGVVLGSPAKVPIMRAWYVNGAGSRSNAGGNVNLDDDNGRLLELASETQK